MTRSKLACLSATLAAAVLLFGFLVIRILRELVSGVPLLILGGIAFLAWVVICHEMYNAYVVIRRTDDSR